MLAGTTLAQQTINHSMTFDSGNRYMWGSTNGSFSLDYDDVFFSEDVDEEESEGPVVNLFGFGEFGLEATAEMEAEMKGKVHLEGFENGTIRVNYPITASLTFPNNNSYDQGDWVTISTNYTVNNGYYISSNFSNSGSRYNFSIPFDIRASLGIEVLLGFTSFTHDLLSGEINQGSGSPFPPGSIFFPGGSGFGNNSFDPNHVYGELDIARVTNQGLWVGTGSVNGNNLNPSSSSLPILGIGSGLSSFPLPTPYDLATRPSNEQSVLNDVGITQLEAALPDVNLGTTSLVGRNLVNSGSDKYFDIDIEVTQFLSQVTPSPYSDILENLEGSHTVDGIPPMSGDIAEIDWTLFSTVLDLRRRLYQDFEFRPRVYAYFTFPVAVEWTEFQPGVGTVNSGNSRYPSVQLGNQLRYKYPCYYEEMEISVRYSINGRFYNHTYDRMPIDLDMEALHVDVDLPSIVLIPEISIDACVDVPYPCGTFLDPQICYEEVCPTEDGEPLIIVEEVSHNLPNFEIGPEWTHSENIGSYAGAVQEDWVDRNWTLGGFSVIQRGSFTMEASPITISNTSTDVSCYGAGDGSINVTINAVNHASPYTYNWSNGSTVQDPNGLDGGPHQLMAQDANGCELFTGATISEPPLLEVSYSKVDKPCGGGPDVGSIDVSVFGGTPPYAYSWNTGATSEDLSGLGAGTYTLTVTDARNCNQIVTVTIDEPITLGHNALVSNVNCLNGNDGAIDVTSFGGSLPYSYSWSSGQNSEDISGLIAGTYTLTLTDAKGCTDIVAHTVTEPPTAVALTSAPIDVSCFGGNDGGVDITTSGGTPGYSYSWISSLGGLLPYTTEDISSIPTGEYTVQVTDNNGCQIQITQLVDQPNAPLASSPIITDVPCFGDPTGSIDPVISGGTAPYSYAWSNGATTAMLTNVVSGAYTLTITDARGCQDIYNYVISEPPAPLSMILNGTDILCNGDATGSVDAIVSGGTPQYTYAWSNSSTTPIIDNLIAGNYSLTVTDNNGCTISDNITLNEPIAPLNVTSIITDVDCFGNNSGAIDATVTGGTTPYAHEWSNSGTVILVDTTDDISNQVADTYTLLVTDANGCEFELASTIAEPSAPLAITGTIDHVSCFGFNDGAIDITVTGGTTTYAYNWSSGQTTDDISNVIAGTYLVTVTDFNNCTDSLAFTINQPLAPLNIELFAFDVLCNGDATGSVNSEISGGTLPYSYDWSNSETTTGITEQPAGVYTLTITDAQGCTAFSGTTVNEPTPLLVNPIVTDASCYNYSDGIIELNITGGIQPYYFNWGNQNEIMLNNPSETLDSLEAEDYFIRVRDENGCINEQYVSVGQPTPFIADFIITEPLCFQGNDGSVDVSITGGTQPYASVWSDGQTTEDASNLAAGDYTFTVTDAQGCEINESLTVEQPPQIEISYQMVEVSCIDQSDGAIYVTPYGGTLPYTYLWSTGSDELNAENLSPSVYAITIMDDHSCESTFSFDVVMNYSECLIIPNSFTPNNDNYNDTWIIGNIDLYPNATVKIFNKWGNEIYSSSGAYDPWDGTHFNKPMPSEVYYYIIQLNNDEGNEYTGNVTIVR